MVCALLKVYHFIKPYGTHTHNGGKLYCLTQLLTQYTWIYYEDFANDNGKSPLEKYVVFLLGHTIAKCNNFTKWCTSTFGFSWHLTASQLHPRGSPVTASFVLTLKSALKDQEHFNTKSTVKTFFFWTFMFVQICLFVLTHILFFQKPTKQRSADSAQNGEPFGHISKSGTPKLPNWLKALFFPLEQNPKLSFALPFWVTSYFETLRQTYQFLVHTLILRYQKPLIAYTIGAWNSLWFETTCIEHHQLVFPITSIWWTRSFSRIQPNPLNTCLWMVQPQFGRLRYMKIISPYWSHTARCRCSASEQQSRPAPSMCRSLALGIPWLRKIKANRENG